MNDSVFSRILGDLVRALPGARGAIFVDWEGEAVDAFCMEGGDGFMRLLGAHWGVIYYLIRTALTKLERGRPTDVILRFENQHVIVNMVTDEYLVVTAMERGANLGRALDLVRRTVERLRTEM